MPGLSTRYVVSRCHSARIELTSFLRSLADLDSSITSCSYGLHLFPLLYKTLAANDCADSQDDGEIIGLS